MAFTRANIPQLVLGSMLPISSGFGSLPDTRILQAAVVLMFGIRGTGLPFSTAKIPFGSLENTNAVLLTILVDSQGSIQSSLFTQILYRLPVANILSAIWPSEDSMSILARGSLHTSTHLQTCLYSYNWTGLLIMLITAHVPETHRRKRNQ